MTIKTSTCDTAFLLERQPLFRMLHKWNASPTESDFFGTLTNGCPRTKGVTDGIPSLRLKAWKPGATNVRVRVQKSKNQGL